MNDVCLEELDFENTQLRCENIMLKLDGNLLMLDKAFSMYDYVTKYGVDRSFVKVHNTHYELDALVGMIYPCNESFDGFDVDLANYKQVCMEGILEAITNAAKWVIEKLKALCSWIGEMFDKFLGLFRNKNESNKKNIKALKMMRMRDKEFDAQVVSPTAVAKYDEIIKKIESADNSNTPNATAAGAIPGLSAEEFSNIKSFIENFTTKNKNQHIEKITIKDNAGKDRVLNIADRTTADFEKLILTIGKIIKDNKDKISQYEKNIGTLQDGLNNKIMHNGKQWTNANTDEKKAEFTRVFNDSNNALAKIEKIKSDVKRYKNTVSILSKLLKLILDDTKVTEGMLKHISTHVKRSNTLDTATSTSNNDAEKDVNNIPELQY